LIQIQLEDLTELLKIDPSTKHKKCKKGDILQVAGRSMSTIFYVKKGLLRSYTIDDKGKEHIFMFATESWMIADIESQEFNQPAKLFIDCIEDSEIITFDLKLFKKMDLSKDRLNKNNSMLLRRVAVLQRRVLMLMSSSAKERYEFFLETYPELPNRVPQRMIASYLGITPQALSTIRGEIARKK
jgi:CRP-like cAMP-binding protein